jgi:hypothetical protein
MLVDLRAKRFKRSATVGADKRTRRAKSAMLVRALSARASRSLASMLSIAPFSYRRRFMHQTYDSVYCWQQ